MKNNGGNFPDIQEANVGPATDSVRDFGALLAPHNRPGFLDSDHYPEYDDEASDQNVTAPKDASQNSLPALPRHSLSDAERQTQKINKLTAQVEKFFYTDNKAENPLFLKRAKHPVESLQKALWVFSLTALVANMAYASLAYLRLGGEGEKYLSESQPFRAQIAAPLSYTYNLVLSVWFGAAGLLDIRSYIQNFHLQNELRKINQEKPHAISKLTLEVLVTTAYALAAGLAFYVLAGGEMTLENFFTEDAYQILQNAVNSLSGALLVTTSFFSPLLSNTVFPFMQETLSALTLGCVETRSVLDSEQKKRSQKNREENTVLLQKMTQNLVALESYMMTTANQKSITTFKEMQAWMVLGSDRFLSKKTPQSSFGYPMLYAMVTKVVSVNIALMALYGLSPIPILAVEQANGLPLKLTYLASFTSFFATVVSSSNGLATGLFDQLIQLAKMIRHPSQYSSPQRVEMGMKLPAQLLIYFLASYTCASMLELQQTSTIPLVESYAPESVRGFLLDALKPSTYLVTVLFNGFGMAMLAFALVKAVMNRIYLHEKEVEEIPVANTFGREKEEAGVRSESEGEVPVPPGRYEDDDTQATAEETTPILRAGHSVIVFQEGISVIDAFKRLHNGVAFFKQNAGEEVTTLLLEKMKKEAEELVPVPSAGLG